MCYGFVCADHECYLACATSILEDILQYLPVLR